MKLTKKLKQKPSIKKVFFFTTLALCVGLFFFWYFSKPAIASWFDDNWAYRKAVPVTNNTTAETNVYINFTGATALDTSDATRFQADCGDLRFTKQNGELLPYYIASGCGTSNTVVHVLFDTFPAGLQTIYIYYGNPLADNGFNLTDFSNLASNYTIGTLAAEEKGTGPVAYWDFNDGQGLTAQDSSANNADGTLAGTPKPTWQSEDQCVFGKCLFFEGTTANITVATAINNVMSISMWVRPITTASTVLLDLDGGTHTITTDGSSVISAGGFTSPTYYINGVQKTTPTLTANTWQYITITTGTAFNSTSSLTIGKTGSTYFKGFIDEVKIYPYARTQAQIRADFNGRSSRIGSSAQIGSQDPWLSNGLVGYWKMDEASGNATDYSGNSTTLTNTGTATFTAGKYGNGGTLNGSSQYFTASSNTPLSVTGDLTISSWIKPSANTASTQYDITGKWDGANTSYLLSQYGAELRLYLNSSSNYVTTTNASLATGTWYHVMATYSASTQTVKIFLNGTQLTTTTTGTIPTSINSNSARFTVGTSYPTGSPTIDFPGSTADGYIQGYGSSSDFATARSTSYSVDTTLTVPYVGRYFTSQKSTNRNNRGYLKFDTSVITAAGTVTQANLKLVVTTDNTTTDYDVKIIKQDWSAQDPLSDANREAAYDNCLTSTADDSIWRNTSGMSTNTQYTSGNLSTAWINKTGSTYYCLANSRDYDALTDLIDSESINIASAENATSAYRPVLTVTYTGPVAANFYNGSIDEARVYNRALSPKEVSDLYNWAPGPVGYWKMDDKVAGDSKTLVDFSGNGNSMTTNWGANTSGMNCSAVGKYGGGCSLDGTDDYIGGGVPSALNNLPVNGDFTVEAWIYDTTTGNVANIINKDNNYANGWNLQTGSSGNISFNVSLSGTDMHRANSSTFTRNTWQHVTAVYKQSLKRGYIYINGKEISYAAAWGDIDGVGTVDADSARNLEIGRQNGNNTNLLKGLIDDVRIYNYARTQKQIVSDMNADHPAVGSPVGSPVAYWDFDEGGNTIANDLTPNANNLTLSASSWTNSGKFGKAWNGIGTNWLSRADDPDFDVSDTDDYAISLWFKSDSANNPGATEYLVDKGPIKASSAGYAIYANTDGTVCFGIDDDTTWGPDVSSCSPTDIYDATWHHLVAVRDHTGTDKTVLYVDGILKDSDSDTTTATLANAQILYLGDSNGADGGDEFNGDLDEVKVYRYALTASEVKTDFNRGSSLVLGALGNLSTLSNQAGGQEYCIPGDTTACLGPIGRWDFEEGRDNTCLGGSNDICDSSTNGKDGLRLANATWVSGKYGKGLYFAGIASNNNIQFGDNFDITGTDNMTWEVWFKSDGQNRSNRRGIGGKKGGETSGTAGYWMDINTSGILEALISNATTQITLTSTNAVDDSKWHHMVILINRTTGNSQMYLDGKLEDTDTTPTGDLSNAVNYCYGSSCQNSAVFPFKGTMDQAMIFNYVRTPAQIAYDFNKGAPIGYWDFDECQGNTLNDLSGNSNTGTITIGTGAGTGHQDSAGTCTDGTGNTAWNNGATGKRNSSLNFDGIDDYVNLGDLTFTESASQLSWSIWVKPTSLATAKCILCKLNADGTQTGWGLVTDSSDSSAVRVVISNTSSNLNSYGITPIGKLVNSSWTHVVAVFDGTQPDNASKLKIYINGVNQTLTFNASQPTHAIPTSTQATTSNAHIGNSSDGFMYFNGAVDESKIFNYALTSTQVKNLYNGGAVNYAPVTGSP